METLIPLDELLDLLTDAELGRMEQRAWCTASAAWSRYHAALHRDDPLATTNLLNGTAWTAENWWRAIHDVSEARRAERLVRDHLALPL